MEEIKMGFVNEILKVIPEDYVTTNVKWVLEITAHEYNEKGMISQEIALEMVSAVAQVKALTEWSMVAIPEAACNEINRLQDQCNTTIARMMTGMAEVIEFSAIKDRLLVLYNMINDIRDRHTTVV